MGTRKHCYWLQTEESILSPNVLVTGRTKVWLGNALASINVVALRQTRLVPRWVTVCGRVNHLGM